MTDAIPFVISPRNIHAVRIREYNEEKNPALLKTDKFKGRFLLRRRVVGKRESVHSFRTSHPRKENK
jgi:hypothetical protein